VGARKYESNNESKNPAVIDLPSLWVIPEIQERYSSVDMHKSNMPMAMMRAILVARMEVTSSKRM
jgi:hypothetical protein